MDKITYVFLIACASVSFACGSDSDSDNSGSSQDSGTVVSTMDSATANEDASAGNPDAQANNPDAQSTSPDAGTVVEDASTGSPDAETGNPDASSGTAEDCTAQVVIQFYTDANCTTVVSAASPTRTYDTTQSCFSWSGNSAAGENSVTNFKCFRDRLCYTQHPRTLACDNSRPTNKEARTDECVLDTQNPNGGAIYAKIISGTESCPEPPAGYECPLSAEGQGTTGIAACTMEP